MTSPSHGSDLSLAPTLGPFVRTSGRPVRAGLQWLADNGFRSVQLDAALPGLRPRELDQRARRDLAATATRAGLRIAGVDLFIPRQHLIDEEHVDRATQALLAAIEFAGDLGRVPVSVALPLSQLADDIAQAFVAQADGLGVPLIVHAEDEAEALSKWVGSTGEGVVGTGIDPAVLLAAGQDPATRLLSAGNALCAARLSDTQRGLTDGSRLPVGGGDLDLTGYRLSADLAPKRIGPVVLDLRGLTDPTRAATAGKLAWDNAAVTL